MNRKGVVYDVGCVMGGNWRPDYDPQRVQRELEIIRNDLHCTAVRICGQDIGRLMTEEFPRLLQLPTLWTRSSSLATAGNVSLSTLDSAFPLVVEYLHWFPGNDTCK